MKTDVREMLVGAVVILFFGGILGTSYVARDVPATRDGYIVNATFNLIDGLAEGAEVRLGGIPVGHVEKTTLSGDYRAVVAMRIGSSITLPADTAVAIHTDGLFGTKYLELEPGGEEKTLKDGDSISYAQDAVVVTDLLNRIIAQGEARLAKQKQQQ